jgi:hypothetical protein
MKCSQVVFTEHAVLRMHERKISRQEILEIVDQAYAIELYPEDRPFPSQLLLGCIHRRFLHVVIARDPSTEICYIITLGDCSTYGPD